MEKELTFLRKDFFSSSFLFLGASLDLCYGACASCRVRAFLFGCAGFSSCGVWASLEIGRASCRERVLQGV